MDKSAKADLFASAVADIAEAAARGDTAAVLTLLPVASLAPDDAIEVIGNLLSESAPRDQILSGLKRPVELYRGVATEFGPAQAALAAIGLGYALMGANDAVKKVAGDLQVGAASLVVRYCEKLALTPDEKANAEATMRGLMW